MEEVYALCMILMAIVALLSGFPVAFSLAGSSLLIAIIGWSTGHFELSFLGAFPSRVYGVMGNETLMAITLFIFMGVLLERSGIAEELLKAMALCFGRLRGGLGVSICFVGALLAASTGIVGATVVTMGLISLPVMLRHRYSPALSTGIIAASGTLGQIIPPSIILVILGDQMGSAYQQALLTMGDYSGDSVSAGDLFAGALVPGLLLVSCYIAYILIYANLYQDAAPAMEEKEMPTLSQRELLMQTLMALVPPLLLIVSVLGAILIGLTTTMEAASVGCLGSFALALVKRKLNLKVFRSVIMDATKISSMIFMILIGASMFSLVFRGYGGDEIVSEFLHKLPAGKWGAFLFVMLLIFVLGFFLDFFEITFVVVPIVCPILLSMGMDPIWLGVMIAINLQTSFLTPPFGFALFYLRGVIPDTIRTTQMYRGVIPFIIIQLFVLVVLAIFPQLVSFLPRWLYS